MDSQGGRLQNIKERHLLTHFDFLGLSSKTLRHASIRLGTIDTTAPLFTGFIVVIIVTRLDGLDEGSKVLLVFRLDLSNGNSRSSLLVYKGTETDLALDDAVGNAHLAAESGKEDDQFNRVNVVRNNNELSLLSFNQSGNMVQTVFDINWFLRLWCFLAGSLGSSNASQTSLLLNLALRLIIIQQAEKLSSSVLVQGLGKLVDRRWNLQATLKNGALTLKTDILRPFDVTGEITTGLDVVTDGKVTWALFEEWVSNWGLGGSSGFLGNSRSRCDFL